ncbi:MAG TPA: hypothetical protein VF423_02365 [Actinomycetes bacterium]
MATYPEDLDHPLTRGELSLLGIGWREVAGPLWRSPFRGVHVWSATDETVPLQRALDAAGLLPDDGSLGGWAAARVGGVEELDGFSDGERLPVPLCLPPGRSRRRPGVVCWRAELHTDDVTEVGGVRLTVPVRTAFDLARQGTLLQAVTALDVLGRGRPEFLESVGGYLAERPGWRGVPQARRALALASPRARSPRETAFRLFWVLECGLPDPQVNATIRDAAGNLLGMGDLLDPGTGLLGEYDGAIHREELRHALDNAREEGLEDGGLTVVRATNVDLGRFRTRTRQRLLSGRRRARLTPRGGWTWEPGPLPPPVPHW